MSDVIRFNTETNSIVRTNSSIDPWDHLDVDSWVLKQVEWGENNISGKGLVPYIQKLEGTLIGAEIGVCLGVTTELFAREIKNIQKLYAVDNYPTYIDWNGLQITQQRQDRIKSHAYNRLKKYEQTIGFMYFDSMTFSKIIADESLDFIFIDGDHSYEGALRDFQTFYPKIRSGGIFAGHDFNVQTVNMALREFLKEKMNDVITVENNAWLIYKD
jgi:predicted O-methyltransferase YrrM